MIRLGTWIVDHRQGVGACSWGWGRFIPSPLSSSNFGVSSVEALVTSGSWRGKPTNSSGREDSRPGGLWLLPSPGEISVGHGKDSDSGVFQAGRLQARPSFPEAPAGIRHQISPCGQEWPETGRPTSPPLATSAGPRASGTLATAAPPVFLSVSTDLTSAASWSKRARETLGQENARDRDRPGSLSAG